MSSLKSLSSLTPLTSSLAVFRTMSDIAKEQKGKGWENEPVRHSLASQGVKTVAKAEHLQDKNIPNIVKETPSIDGYETYMTAFDDVELPNNDYVFYKVYEFIPDEMGQPKKVCATIKRLDESNKIIQEYNTETIEHVAGDDAQQRLDYTIKDKMNEYIQNSGFNPEKFHAPKWRQI